jgi:ABC-type uncharacterized transport system YnjBCD ATPase subunit
MDNKQLSDDNQCLMSLTMQSFDQNLDPQQRQDIFSQISSLTQEANQLTDDLKDIKKLKDKEKK